MTLEVLGEFNIKRLQILNEEGDDDKDLSPSLSDNDLLYLYRSMLLSRRADERLLKLQRQGRLGTCGTSIGQEATIFGAVFAMTENDWLVPSYREINAFVMRGVPLSKIYMQWNGVEEGNHISEAKRTLPISIIVGSQTLHAVGIAYAMKHLEEKNSAAVTFFGEGGSSQGEVYEAMNFASVWKAPTIFICQNNQWAISLPREKQTSSKTIAQKALAFDMPGIQVDGNDVLAIYKATKDALVRAYQGLGPTLIEAENYRLEVHTTSDDPTRYRKKEEVDKWWKKDPLIRFRLYMEKKGIWSEDKQKDLEEEIKKEIELAVTAYESIKDLKVDAPFDNIFGTTHSIIEEQRSEFLSELKRIEEKEKNEDNKDNNNKDNREDYKEHPNEATSKEEMKEVDNV
ncbi:MAG: pyruvate dehydrogenase (acetyl-transferring) E1 component subunit alpha [Oligoflexia bacterium]|nr:pyruvate dehydrogenase (acetyl-transferring) E1 component subunit alpha [Oligoflexia bacterium]